jgi:hypothetical protein
MKAVEAVIKMFDPAFDVAPWPSVGASQGSVNEAAN